MPNRGELAVRVVRYDVDATAEADAWLILGFCAFGLLVSVFLAVHAQPITDIPALVVQYNVG
jgi:hypothetical protein